MHICSPPPQEMANNSYVGRLLQVVFLIFRGQYKIVPSSPIFVIERISPKPITNRMNRRVAQSTLPNSHNRSPE